MIVLTQPQIESLKAGLIPTDLALSFQRDINYMIELNGYCLISIYENGDADVIDESELSDDDLSNISSQATLLRLR